MKVCTRCGVEKPLDKFYKATKFKDGLSYMCAACSKECGKERIRLSKLRYVKCQSNSNVILKECCEKWLDGKLHISKMRRNKWLKENSKLVAIYRKAYAKRISHDLKDAYITSLLTKHDRLLKVKYIPIKLIEAKRLEIKNKRLIKEMSK